MAGKERIYWDTCIFIAHLTNEQRVDPLDQLGISEFANLFDMGQVDLVTSTITLTEFMESSLSTEEYKSFLQLFSRTNFQLSDVTRDVAELAGEIRSNYRINNSTLSTPDCIHIATAIQYKCDILHTFDGSSKNRPGILGLTSPIARKYNLRIEKPKPSEPNPQLNLNL
ncbi:MAG: hypothetical protein A2X25_14690 [Chloroflexi bacterium GWB2_49_20]|nr:MAG: hypothetical protein A2X25_14690 [Chloroflexi bacterium GWB2_49_20]OGN77244.1 MAG: hypothetical protein A2X26_08555 [Chloroflexi bacterium GWC2_49_37]OGN84759.1 MAG: hypothetical protein A2X27_15550 [Chloroflexi bacterium GWD2_49_16]